MDYSWSAPREQLSCPVCQDIFSDPVLLACSHSFCNDCVQQWWRTKGVRQCPLCKAVSSHRKPTRNLVLKNLCEVFALEVESSQFCHLHKEKFKLYCQDHRAPACVVCRDSKEHRNHRFTPVDEAAELHRNLLGTMLGALREKVKLFSETKANWEKTDGDIRRQAQETEAKIREEFEVLRQFLQSEEGLRIAALKEEEGRKRSMMKDKIAALTRDISALESTIKNIETGLTQDATSFLLQSSELTEEAQRPLPDHPQHVAGALISVAKYLGNMGFSVWCKMKEIVSYTPVVLDPNTAHQHIYPSESLTSVTCGPPQSLPATPERMEQHRSVLGFEGFSSGSHSWDVEVGDGNVWALGAVASGAQRMGDLRSGLWMVRFCNGKFTAFCPSRPPCVIPLKDKPQRIRVHLDWNRGRLSFSDLETHKVIHTFTHTFTDRMFPYFNTWNVHPLTILPMKLYIAVTPVSDNTTIMKMIL
ncbi:hypothetical protein Q5P01_013295 [Channa striata]|uniref:Zinc-binding protein A33-like n=1 Tax=Channa striata TaxID=64152 RepID=A0AA88MMG5_CHASR|nr:hypothetical protein Q5P01_013295 [Channa striata]